VVPGQLEALAEQMDKALCYISRAGVPDPPAEPGGSLRPGLSFVVAPVPQRSGPQSPVVPAALLFLMGIAILSEIGWWAAQFLPFLRGGQPTTALLLEVRPETSRGRTGSLTYLYPDLAGEGHQGTYTWAGGKNSHNRLHAGESVPVWFLKDTPVTCYFGEPDVDLRSCLGVTAFGVLLLVGATAALWEWRRQRRQQAVVVSSFWWVIRT